MREKRNNTHKKGDRDESNSLHIIHSRAALSTRSPLSITRLTWMQTWCYTKERAALISSSLNQCLLWGDKEEEWLSLKTGEDVCYRACTWPDTRNEISTLTPDSEACLWKFLRNTSSTTVSLNWETHIIWSFAFTLLWHQNKNNIRKDKGSS